MMRCSAAVCAMVLSVAATAQLPNGAPAAGYISPTGVSEIDRIADAYTNPPDDVKHLQTLLRDWAGLSYYTEANAKLAGTKVDVVFLGDSITHNWANPRFSTFMQGHGYVGRGIGGQVTSQMVLRMPQDVLALKPKVVVLLGGTNDLALMTPPDILRMIEDNIAMMADLATAHGERIILTSVMPVNDDHKKLTAIRPPDKILALNAWMKQYAADHKLQYVDYYSALSDGKDRMKSDLSGDGLHPNVAGYKVIEPLIQKAIKKELKRQ
ncbi:MAG: hypothetical protein JSS87_15120 [Acidobacteria bacterium]|nr:hypothetical protein [Acidobacteriota bacterium]